MHKKKWMARSRQMRKLIDRCVICWSDRDLHVHHLRYRKGGRGSKLEEPEDLLVLCRECHDELHERNMTGPKKFLMYREARREELGDKDTAIALSVT